MKKRYVSQLNSGDEFELDGGQRFRLIYLVGESRAYVQSLATRHVELANGTEFDAPGTKSNMAVSTEFKRYWPGGEEQ